MRKTAAFLAVVMFIISVFVNVQASDTVTVIVDGREIEFTDAPAYIDSNGRTQVPTRFVGEALGAYVGWDENARRVTVSRFSPLFDGESAISNVTIIEFEIGSENYYTRVSRQGRAETHTMDTKAVIENSRTYIPVRYVAEALNANVDWDSESRTVTIISATKKVGDFTVPQSYAESAHTFDISGDGKDKGVVFSVNFSPGSIYMASMENRIDLTMNILLQQIGQDSTDKLRKFIANHYDHTSTDSNPIDEIFLDSKSERNIYISMWGNRASGGGGYSIFIFDKGCYPTNKFFGS